jgi:flagellar basal body-associated protein FliL
MGQPPRQPKSGILWLFLLFLPVAVVIAGLAAIFIWQGMKGGITPKWKDGGQGSNAAPARSAP